ncbi:hypothetical protein LZ32DRAFT_192062 [Colletotrichum eremochloae]|nr:hypothetical protein LZ32DRAFT_192062 [Colletotrichum eremochloae]
MPRHFVSAEECPTGQCWTAATTSERHGEISAFRNHLLASETAKGVCPSQVIACNVKACGGPQLVRCSMRLAGRDPFPLFFPQVPQHCMGPIVRVIAGRSALPGSISGHPSHLGRVGKGLASWEPPTLVIVRQTDLSSVDGAVRLAQNFGVIKLSKHKTGLLHVRIADTWQTGDWREKEWLDNDSRTLSRSAKDCTYSVQASSHAISPFSREYVPEAVVKMHPR